MSLEAVIEELGQILLTFVAGGAAIYMINEVLNFVTSF